MWWACVAAAWGSAETSTLDASTLIVDVPQGAIAITVDPSAAAIVVALERSRWNKRCTQTLAVENGAAVLRVVRGGGPLRVCRVDVVARVPSAVLVQVTLGGGDVSLAGVAGATVKIGVGDLVVTGVLGALDAELGTGDLVGSFLGSKLRGRVTSGQIRLAGLSAPADVSVGMGKVELTYDAAPVGEIAFSSAAGTATVILPAGTVVALGDTDARLGRLINELAVDEASATVLRAGTHAGNVEILSGAPPASPPQSRSDP